MRNLIALALLLVSGTAAAAGDKERRQAKDFESELVREIVRGFYVKSNVGSTIYFNTHGVRRLTGQGLLTPVIGLGIAVGSDFIDKERFSAAWEVQLAQGLFNGPRTDEILAGMPAFVQGDVHTYGALAAVEASTYVTRRFSVGVKGGGGITLMPLLMNPEEYELQIVQGVWGGQPAKLHAGPLPTILVAPTIEYYTKLSHFSVGVDVDVTYVLGFDLGVAPSGYLKYTF